MALLTWRIAGDAADFTGGPEWQRAKALLRQHGPLGVIDLAKLMNPDAPSIADNSPEYNRAKRLLWKAKQKGRVIVRRFDKRYQLSEESSNA